MEGLKGLYDLLYSPIVTPYNLLENAKLDNYSYVNYYKGDKGLIAEMECSLDSNKQIKYYYHFNEDDELIKIFSKEEDKNKKLVFDRDIEISFQKERLLRKRLDDLKKLSVTG